MALNTLPAVILIVPTYVLIKFMGLYDNLLGLLFIYVAGGVPFGTWVLRGYFMGISKDLEEAAMIDGCSRISALFRIVIPVAIPGIIVVALLHFASIWGEFQYAFILLDSKSNYTLSIGIRSFMKIDFIAWNEIMAIASLTVVPTLLIFLFFQKYLRQGIMAGALKG